MGTCSTSILGEGWQWVKTENPRINHWVLQRHCSTDTVYHCSVIEVSGRSDPSYRIQVRGKQGLLYVDDFADTLEGAMQAGETYTLFQKGETWNDY